METGTMNITVPEDMVKKIELLVELSGVSLDEMVTNLLDDYIEK